MNQRTAIGMAAVLFVIAATGCGGTSGGPQDATGQHDGSASHLDASIDGSVDDFGCGGNTACPTAQDCCSMPGATTTFSCVAPASCPMGDHIICDGPDECGGATPVCCGVDV